MSKSAPVKLKLRPSDASRWTVCTASPGFIRDMTPYIVEEVHDYTTEGSLAHELAETILNGNAVEKGKYPDEMVANIGGYVDLIKRQNPTGSDLYVEHEVRTYYNPDQRGFVDVGIVDPAKNRVFITDLKYGAGVSVQAKGNKQLAIYGRSFMDEMAMVYEFTPETLVTMTIYQPRIDTEEPLRMWVVTYKELIEWTDDHITGIANDILLNPSPDQQAFAPSEDACRFCSAASLCKSRLASLAEELPMELMEPGEKLLPPSPDSLSPMQLSRILNHSKELKKWLDGVEDYAKSALLNGRLDIPKWKVVSGRSIRKWGDEEQAEEFLRKSFKAEEIFTKKLISAPQAEKLISGMKRNKQAKLDQFQKLVVKPDGGPTLAHESDKRPSISLCLDSTFVDENLL